MGSRTQVEIAHKFYQAQDAMKFLHGDNYESKVAETADVIRRVAAAHKCDIIPAVTICVEKIVEKFPSDNGLLVAMLLAAAVEMAEWSQAQ